MASCSGPRGIMGLLDRDRIRRWAEGIVQEHGTAVGRLIGVDPPLPPVTIDVDPDGPPGVTDGLTITLSERWFLEHPDDIGCVLHELTHAYMRAPDYDATTIWLIEGIADHVRDVLGFDTSWTFAHFEPGKAMAGYQTTADLLTWLEGRRPGAVSELSRRLSDGSYRETVFAEVGGAPLTELVAAYEADRNIP
jgi:Peptidase of plants and bacteria